MNRKPNSEPVRPNDFFQYASSPMPPPGALLDDGVDDTKYADGVRPPGEILAELRHTLDVVKGRSTT